MLVLQENIQKESKSINTQGNELKYSVKFGF